MTTVLYEPAEHRLRVTGHAGAAQKDHSDPVCAGASALAFALVEAATNRPDYGTSLYISGNKATIDVRCSPEPEAAHDCRQMFEIIMGGLLLIAETHPENMSIEIGG